MIHRYNAIFNNLAKHINNSLKLQLFMKRIKVVIYAMMFIIKIRSARFHLARKKDLIRQWTELQDGNINNIRTVLSFVENSPLPKQKCLILLAGVEQIRLQSQQLVQQLKIYVSLKQKLIFGKNICDICSSYQAYHECLKTFIQKKAVLKQLSKDKRVIEMNSSNPIVLQQYFQRLVFRSYQVAIIIKKYIKYLPGNHSDKQYFTKALDIITNLNKKYDLIIKQGQKERQVVRIQKLLNKKIFEELVYSKKCYSHEGEVHLHVFQSLIMLENQGRVKQIPLDMFSLVYLKQMQYHQIACVLAKDEVYYFFWQQQRELWRFMATMKKVIACLSVSKSIFGGQLKTQVSPFLLARVVDYREQQNLKGCKEDLLIINISCIKQAFPVDIIVSMSTSIKQSQSQLSKENEQNQPKELNQTVIFTTEQLRKIKKQIEQNYCIQKMRVDPVITFGGKFTSRQLKMLIWQSYLNTLFRIKNVIENPIWLLKQLKVTEVMYESVIAEQIMELSNNQFQHCHLCSNLSFTSIGEFLQCRQICLNNKYTTERHRYCSNIFNRIKGEMLNIPLFFLKNVEELYLWTFFKEGGIDYAFHKKIACQKKYFVKIVIPSLERIVCQIQATKYTLVSEAIDQISFLINLPALIGYRLMVCYQSEEHFLNSNQRLLPIITQYNIRYTKNEAKSFFKKLKSIGSYLQLFEQGALILRKVIFCPQLLIHNKMSKTWQIQNLLAQFKSGKLVGLSKQIQFQLLILFFLLDKHSVKQELPIRLKEQYLEKYIPPTIDTESEEAYLMLNKIYDLFKSKTQEDLERLMEVRAKVSPFYQRYITEVQVAAICQSLTTNKRIHSVLIGFGWNGISIFTLNHHLILDLEWNQIEVKLLQKGLSIQQRGEVSILLCGRQLYELRNICLLYKSLKSLVKLIKR